MSKEESIQELLRFIRRTERFKETHGDVTPSSIENADTVHMTFAALLSHSLSQVILLIVLIYRNYMLYRTPVDNLTSSFFTSTHLTMSPQIRDY